MSRLMRLLMLVVLHLAIHTDSGGVAAQGNTPLDAPILWLSAEHRGSPTHIYTWDGQHAINLTPNADLCRDFFPVPPDRWAWVCGVDGVERLFVWDGRSQRPQIVSGRGSVARSQPAISRDGRIAFVELPDQAADNGDLVVWDNGETQVVSGSYGVYGWEPPRWTENGALIWRVHHASTGEYGIYYWDGERARVVADRLPTPLYFAYGYGLGALWTADNRVAWQIDLYDQATDELLRTSLFYWAGGEPIEVAAGTALYPVRWLDDGRMFGLIKSSADEPYSVFRWDGVTLEIVPTAQMDEPYYVLASLTPDERLVWYAIPAQNRVGRIYLFDGEHNTDVTPDIGAIQTITPREGGEYLITADRDGVRSIYVWTPEELLDISSGLDQVISARWTPDGAAAILTGEAPQQIVHLWTRDGERQVVIEMPGLDTLSSFWRDKNQLIVQARDEMGVPRVIEWRSGVRTVIREGHFLHNVRWHPNGDAALLEMSTTADPDAVPDVFVWQDGTLAQVSAGLYLHAIQWRRDSIALQLAPSISDLDESHDIYLWDGRQLNEVSDNPYWDGFHVRIYMG